MKQITVWAFYCGKKYFRNNAINIISKTKQNKNKNRKISSSLKQKFAQFRSSPTHKSKEF